MNLEIFKNLTRGKSTVESGAGDPGVELATAGNGSGGADLETGISLDPDEKIEGVSLPLKEIGRSPDIEDLLIFDTESRVVRVPLKSQSTEELQKTEVSETMVVEVVIPERYAQISGLLSDGLLQECANEIMKQARTDQVVGPIVLTGFSQNGSRVATFESVLVGHSLNIARAGLGANVKINSENSIVEPYREGYWYQEGVSKWSER